MAHTGCIVADERRHRKQQSHLFLNVTVAWGCTYGMTDKKMVFLIALLALTGCEPKPRAGVAALPEYAVQTVHPSVQDVTIYCEWIGRLEAEVTAEVLPHVEGYVKQRCFTNGQTVQKGQVLYLLDDSLYAEALSRARQEETEAAAQAREAQENVEYYRPLVQDGAVARQTFTEALRGAEAADAALAAARAAVESAQTNVDYCTLRSPLNGIAGFADADVGSYVSPNGNPMVTVSCIEPMRVTFSITEQDWLNQGGVHGALRPGAELEVVLANGNVYPHRAVITGVDNVVADTMGTLQMDARVPNEGDLLRPGMFVNVRAAVKVLNGAMMVPVGAIVAQQGKQFVLVAEASGKVKLVPVTTGVTRQGLIVVQGALNPQDCVVTVGTQQALMALAGRAKLHVLTPAQGGKD